MFSYRISLGWLFVCLSVFTLIIIPLLLEGMFMDSVQYSAVAKNLADGYGSFWFPQFSSVNPANMPYFAEQPPLVLIFQSLILSLLKGHWISERLYAILILFGSFWLITKIWILLKQEKSLTWLPVLLWICIPICFWSHANNMLENSMSFFCLLSSYFYIKSTSSKQLLYITLSGLAVVLAFLSKGIPSLFIITVPFFFNVIVLTNSKKAWIDSLFISAVIFTSFTLLISLNTDAYQSLSTYFNDRVLLRLTEQDNHTVQSKWFTVTRLLSELLVPFIVTTILWLANKKSKNTTSKTPWKIALFFLAIACSASLPLSLTSVQKGFYFVASLPYFAFFFSLLLTPYLKSSKRIIPLYLILIPMLISIPFIYRSGFTRNQTLLEDIYQLKPYILNEKQILSSENIMNNRWDLKSYMVRYLGLHPVPFHEDSTITFYIGKSAPNEQYEIQKKFQEFNLYALTLE